MLFMPYVKRFFYLPSGGFSFKVSAKSGGGSSDE